MKIILITTIIFRDNQNYDAMISLIDDLRCIENISIINAPGIRFLYAFALNRFSSKVYATHSIFTL